MNFRRWAVSLLAATGFVIATTAQASAQTNGRDMGDAEGEEFACVYSALMDLDDDAYFNVVDAYITEVTEGDLYESAVSVIMPVVEDCADQHNWSSDQQEIAMTMGIAGTVADAIESYFLDEGFTDDDLDDIISLVDTMPDEDVYNFLAEDWRRNADFKQTVTAHLKGKGVEGDAELVERGMVLLESYLIGMYQGEKWLALKDES
ncbi:MAG: hypothetical protein R3C46_15990 [Hyphomonadaceae bacterium]